ncbi:hypothetical protein IIY66_00395 [Candidatus Saccharibacteria bacterium]|nr:hypothetical protein [Candidatus Saccharibacteria bacterium]
MNNFIQKIPIVRNFFGSEDDSSEWEKPKSTLEVISKEELDALQKETVNDLQQEGVLDPRALFYVRQYVDSKFSKKDFNIEDRFINKANKLDQLYADGKAEIYAEYTGYEELMERAKEADLRLRRAIVALDPDTTIPVDHCRLYDDSASLKLKYEELVDNLKWEKK